MKINLNDKVRVSLNDHGKEIVRKYLTDIYSTVNWRSASIEREIMHYQIKTEWQLHELFQFFGSHIGVGMTIPFESTYLEIIE